ncbi:hypothetical protein EDC02_5936 [Micromonospora sp. Llam0]|uniref:hypothetical protein n=1 Tax=Micromonospora sp. Llam0 TaxID=2485143 RepID=UPI000F4635F6|nr:hypothetical protein [Micromonospora sp. Llam0]ROO51072.1 hypothetical protein EDC02_5936 [Micromonospora sp. Llam0]
MTVHGAYTGIIRDDLANVFNQAAERFPGVDPSGDLYRANMSRLQAVGNVAALATGVMTSVPIYLREGETVSSVTVASATTAANGPTAQWCALYSPTGVLVDQTEDLADEAWGANTAKTFDFDTPVLVAVTGWHRVAVMVTASSAVPTLAGVALHNAVESAALVTGELILAGRSGSTLTDTAPGTIGTLTANAGVPLVILT